MVEVKLIADEETSLPAIIAALQTLAGGKASFSLPEKLAKSEDKQLEKETKSETPRDDQRTSEPAGADTGSDAGSAGDTPDDSGEDQPTYTQADVRKVLVPLSQAGKTKEINTLLKKYGAKNVTSLDPANYAAVIEEAKNL